MGLPVSLPNAILDRIMHSTRVTSSSAADRTARKVSKRFGDDTLPICKKEEEKEDEFTSISLRKFPANFKVLFAFGGYHCSCHRTRLTCANLFQHEGHNFEQWIDHLLAKPDLKGRKNRHRLLQARRENQRFVERLVEKANMIKISLKPD